MLAMILLVVTVGGGAVSLASIHTRKLHAEAPLPIWHLSAKAYGYVPPLPHPDPNIIYHKPPPVGPLYFLNGTILSLAWVSRAPKVILSRRNGPVASLPYKLHALFIDAQSGQLRAARKWPSASPRSRLAPASGGKFVIIDPAQITLYSPNGKLLSKVKLPFGLRPGTGISFPGVSPGGRYIVFNYAYAIGNETACVIIDTESLQIVRTSVRQFPETCFLSVADDGEVLSENAAGGLDIGSLHSNAGRILCPSFFGGRCRYGPFIGSHTLLRIGIGRQWVLHLMQPDGLVLLDDPLPEMQLVERTASCASGRRFALAISRGRGGSELFDIGAKYSTYRVMVYDIPSRRWIYALDAKKEGIKSISGLALSPDGMLLALINQDGILEMFRLPPAEDP